MLLERYYDDTLAQATYLIGCERAREAIVIDPNRDVERCVRAAAAHRLRITAVTETHIHADFLSGSRDLARAARASLLLSDHGGKDWSYGHANEAKPLRDGDTITVGTVRLTVLHTPGHTPEHVCFVVTDTATGDRPMGIVTGDFVFVGDVGRPDLLERAANVAGSMAASARQLHASLRRLAEYPDYVQIWPGHGAGSACGKSLSPVPQSTLGYERLFNPAFQQRDEDAFVQWVLADQPEPPRYFATMKRLNRDGPPPKATASLPELDVAAIEDAIAKNHWVVDVRSSADFAKAHLAGTINVPSAKSLATYAGTVLTYDRPIVIVAKSQEQAMTAVNQLALIGMDRIDGWISFEKLQTRRAGRIASLPTIEPAALSQQLARNGPRVIDVRGRSEWRAGHLPEATHIYLGDLSDRIEELRSSDAIVVHCESGTRSSIAASLLRARGIENVANLVGGMTAWRKAGLPVSQER